MKISVTSLVLVVAATAQAKDTLCSVEWVNFLPCRLPSSFHDPFIAKKALNI
jgi:hypothetical protein